MTVAEARKEIMTNDINLNVPSFKTNIPPTQDQIQYMGAGAYVHQNLSIGSGWQFSRTYFAPYQGTGAYLLWKAHVDDGRIADINDCRYMYIYPGSTRGALIKASDPAGKWGEQYLVQM